MEGTMTFISILFIVFGVLQIILFFKLWVMTNNVSKMHKMQSAGDSIIKAKIHYLKDEKEKAGELLMDSFLNDISVLHSSVHKSDWAYEYRDLYTVYSERFKKVGITPPDFCTYGNPDNHL